MMRIGHGYDVHKLTNDRKLVLGGVEIPFHLGLLGHSDADVLLHAIMDSLLGALALGDIGKIFPDTDMQFKDIDSTKLLEQVIVLVKDRNYKISNIDATIIAQNPKLSPFVPRMRENIAKIASIDLEQINIKATTEENLGFTGEGKGIAAHSVCLLYSEN